MAFTKCWLAYPEIRGCRCDAISLHTELTGETIDRAKAELAEGFKGLYGAALTEGDDITLALDTTLDPEGYRLKAADGHCTIEGGSEVGVFCTAFFLHCCAICRLQARRGRSSPPMRRRHHPTACAC